MTHSKPRAEAIERLVARVEADGAVLYLFEDSLDAARRAAEHGWIPAEAVEAVALSVEAAGAPSDAMALVVDGRLDMAEIAQAYPISDVEDLQGLATVGLDFTVKGDRVERLTGGIAASGIVVRSSGASPLQISTVAAHFTPKETEVRTFHAVYGRSDIAASGSLSPFDVILDALLGDDETILGDLRLTSKLIDLDEFSDEDFPFALGPRFFLGSHSRLFATQSIRTQRRIIS